MVRGRARRGLRAIPPVGAHQFRSDDARESGSEAALEKQEVEVHEPHALLGEEGQGRLGRGLEGGDKMAVLYRQCRTILYSIEI